MDCEWAICPSNLQPTGMAPKARWLHVLRGSLYTIHFFGKPSSQPKGALLLILSRLRMPRDEVFCVQFHPPDQLVLQVIVVE